MPEVAEMLDAVVSWPMFLVALFAFGFAPGAVLRLIVLAFPKCDPRREELLAEVYVIPRLERPFWVAQQLEVALCEGLWERLVWAATGRIIHRWRLLSGIKQNRLYPETFWIPAQDEKAAVLPGHLVKLFFFMSDRWSEVTGGFAGERVWVEVTSLKRGHMVGTLINDPVVIPRLCSGDRVRFKPEHIIDIEV